MVYNDSIPIESSITLYHGEYKMINATQQKVIDQVITEGFTTEIHDYGTNALYVVCKKEHGSVYCDECYQIKIGTRGKITVISTSNFNTIGDRKHSQTVCYLFLRNVFGYRKTHIKLV